MRKNRKATNAGISSDSPIMQSLPFSSPDSINQSDAASHKNCYSMLDRIASPDDLKDLKDDELDELCSEIREVLVDTVSQTGGHLASNLGVVELTVALHRCFDSPKDQIVWDVGHQVYTHKLLTGRKQAFFDHTLRKEGGVSGFSRPYESEHDIFHSGHSSVSVSEAYGLLCARLISGDDGYVVAVIGDGALSGGLAYEGLNNAGQTNGRLIVILNDNKMSISKNVGNMARFLAKKRTRRSYVLLKQRTERILSRIPLIGNSLVHFAKALKSFLKSLLYRANLFEDLGFQYMGPINGHDIGELTKALNAARAVTKRPVLLHVCTVKGKGYSFAEENPKQFHGISKFDVDTGDPIHTEKSFSDAFGESICELAAADSRICAVTAAMTYGTGLAQFRQLYRNRFFDVGIAEEHAVTFCSGLAKNGMLPVFAVYSTFLQRGFDQLIHDASMQRLKIVFAVDRAGFTGEDGESHNGLFDVSYLNLIPSMTILSPCDYAELKSSLNDAFYKYSGAVAIRIPRGLQKPLPERGLKRCNGYVTYGDIGAPIGIVTYGRISAYAMTACERLNAMGISCFVLKLNVIKPLPDETVGLLLDKKSIFFFEETVLSGGIGEVLSFALLKEGYHGTYDVTAIPDCFVAQAGVLRLLQKFGLDADGIFNKVYEGLRQEK